MCDMLKSLLYLHIAGGSAALLSMLVPLLTKKGGRSHRRAGWVFVTGMTVVSITAFLLSAARFLSDPTSQGQQAGAFLFFVSILTAAGVSAGMRVLRTKTRTSPHRSPWDLGLAGLLTLASIAALCYGFIAGRSLFTVFSVVGLLSGGSQLAYWLRVPTHPMHWWFEHMGSMLGSCIAATTAFLVVNADAAIDSKTLVPAMVRRGYGKSFSAAVTAASGVIAPIIPPGIGMLIYGFIADVSVGRLFIGGIVPGLLIALGLMSVVHIISKRRGYGRERTRRAPFRELLRHARAAAWALFLPALILGGLRFGAFTPTEAGAVAAAYAVFVGVFVYREIRWRHLGPIISESLAATAVVMLILGAANALMWVLTWERVPVKMAQTLFAVSDNPYVLLLLINVLLLFLGCVMEGTALLIIVTPILVPVITKLGVDPVHFGLIVVLNLTIGAVTPPVGTILYTVCSIVGLTIEEFTREILPFLVALVAVLLVVTYVPPVVLWLPNLVMGK